MDTKSLDHYTRLIRYHFSDLGFTHAELITRGWDNDVVILDNKLVFRFPKREDYIERFKTELQLLKYLAPKLPFPVPNYSFLPEGLNFGGYKKIEGQEMLPEIFKALTFETEKRIARIFGSFLTTVHSIPFQKANELGIKKEEGGYWWNRKNTELRLVSMREELFHKLNQNEIDWIEHQFNQYLSLSFDYELKVTHSDFSCEHIYIDVVSEEISGVIDFADVELADPALDFSGLWSYGEEFPKMVLDYYMLETDSDFLKRSKFKALVFMVSNMLELEQGLELPVTFEESRKELNEVMTSGRTL